MEAFSDQLLGSSQQVLVVSLPPTLNASSADDLRNQIIRRLPNRDGAGLVLDCADLELVTSIGVAALLQIAEFCADQEAGCRLAAVPERVLKMFSMLNLGEKFEREPTVADAIAALE